MFSGLGVVGLFVLIDVNIHFLNLKVRLKLGFSEVITVLTLNVNVCSIIMN